MQNNCTLANNCNPNTCRPSGNSCGPSGNQCNRNDRTAARPMPTSVGGPVRMLRRLRGGAPDPFQQVV
jgi:hypothetical protein